MTPQGRRSPTTLVPHLTPARIDGPPEPRTHGSHRLNETFRARAAATVHPDAKSTPTRVKPRNGNFTEPPESGFFGSVSR